MSAPLPKTIEFNVKSSTTRILFAFVTPASAQKILRWNHFGAEQPRKRKFYFQRIAKGKAYNAFILFFNMAANSVETWFAVEFFEATKCIRRASFSLIFRVKFLPLNVDKRWSSADLLFSYCSYLIVGSISIAIFAFIVVIALVVLLRLLLRILCGHFRCRLNVYASRALDIHFLFCRNNSFLALNQ